MCRESNRPIRMSKIAAGVRPTFAIGAFGAPNNAIFTQLALK